jgi:hypothetical protein
VLAGLSVRPASRGPTRFEVARDSFAMPTCPSRLDGLPSGFIDERGVAVAGAWVVVEAQTTGEAETHPIATDSALTDQAGTYLVELTAALAPPMDATADLRVVAPSGSGLAGATASGLALRFTFDLQAEDSLHQDFVLADE